MGQFSWITKQGEQVQIGQPVWMVFKSNDGAKIVVKEDSYEGYGEIGGVDYYAALFEMNQDKISYTGTLNDNEKREFGIDLDWLPITHPLAGKLEYPQLFTHSPSQREIDAIDWLTFCPDDSCQGTAYDHDDECW